jgi:hypothetical protein
MKPVFHAAALLLAWAATLLAGEQTVQLRQPWESAYSGDDATGRHVIAL